ncbi:MAG: cytochrome c biogenesis protein CcsA [Candidatus Zixiibacteriota bacterium]|nr:MAG: cytochrome c biogenesis protein CcsA [candidate division Zixibacteria bacterium]
MGSNVPGELAVWLALAFNVTAGLMFFLVGRGKEALSGPAHKAYGAFVTCSILSLLYLFYGFFSHNYAFSYVYEYSERSQPFLYVLSGLWGGQEGTYLLWLVFNALCGYVIIRHAGPSKNYAMAVLGLVNLFFLLILVRLSPFALLPHPAADGLGLNPLLRDPWMVIHPPVIFVGYAMTAVPFALALSALIRNDYADWARQVFPWVAVCSLFLGAGNVLGGYWAYKTLGWGGYWAWDPVENSSFVPWVVSIALLHGLIIEKRTGALRKTNLLLSGFLFLLVLYGTFLTRSGVLADFSVHSFVDLGINQYLVGFMVLFLVLMSALLGLRARKIISANLNYNIFGREFVLWAGLVILLAFGVIVLFWSSLPLITGLFGEARAADIPTYNSFAIPLAILMALLLTVAPYSDHSGYRLPGAGRRALLSYGVAGLFGFGVFLFLLSVELATAVTITIVGGSLALYTHKPALRRALLPSAVAFAVTIIVAVFLGVRHHLYLLFFAMAATALVANLVLLVRDIGGRWTMLGGRLAHLGYGIMLLGIMASSGFDRGDKLVIPRGESRQTALFGLTVQYDGMANDIEHPNNELLLTVDDGSESREIRPQLYYSARLNGIMRKPHIERNVLYDMYVAPEQIQTLGENNRIPLEKGVTTQVGEFSLTFVDFLMDRHGQQSDGMRVAASVKVRLGDEDTTVTPTVIWAADESGKMVMHHETVSFQLGGREYRANLERILADQGMIVLDIPDLISQGPVDQLVVDISKKPVISLVWIGTTLILLGSLISGIRRRAELGQSPRSG